MKDLLLKLAGYVLLLCLFALLFRNFTVGFVIGIILVLAFKWRR